MTVDVENAHIDNSDDDDIPENVHKRLLGAVSQLYKKKRVGAPTRKEPTLQVSEFHLTRAEDSKPNEVNLANLTKVLGKKALHADIKQQISSVKNKSKRLDKPLEKLEAEKVERIVGYENLKKDLSKWNAVVQHQRVAEQVSFPLSKPKMDACSDSTDFLTTFRTPTPLEKEIAEILKASKKYRKEDVGTSIVEAEPAIPLTLKEMMEQRKLMARTRAQRRYKEAKAAKQNKIKSKKFHRIQRKEKIKAQLKEFEELQKKDPEAALKKLDQLEKARAEERASLRHRTTGQWARNLQVRAKYDKEARIALAEQLQKSRELTRKLKEDNSSEEEFGGKEDSDIETNLPADQSNPWTSAKQISEVDQFYSDYKKFRDETKNNAKSEENVKIIKQQTVCRKINAGNHLVQNGFNVADATSVHDKHKKQNHEDEPINDLNRSLNGKTKKIINMDESSRDSLQENPRGKDSASTTKNVHFEVSSGVSQSRKFDSTTRNRPKIEVTFSVLNSHRKNSNSSICKGTTSTSRGSWHVSCVEVTNSQKPVTKEVLKQNKKVSKKKIGANDDSSKRKCKKSKLDLDDMFYEIEDKLSEKLGKKVNKLKQLESSDLMQKNGKSISIEDKDDDYDLTGGLEMRRTVITADVDEALNETSNIDSSRQVPLDESIERSVALSKEIQNAESMKSTDIEPVKTLKVKPKFLKTLVPTDLADREDLDDDEDDAVNGEAEQRNMTIAEAFADDDVVKEFQTEKEDEIKKSQIEDVNLVLPGWGSWGGHNVKEDKRKNERFIVKFPKVLPRRDENKGNVVVNEDCDEPVKPLLVSEVPFPFTSVKDYESSIRAPVGATFLPQKAFRKLTAPTVKTKMGTIIEPMTEDQIVQLQSKP